MNMRRVIFLSFVAVAGFSNAASASPGYLSRNANLRAGPGRDYPVVTRIPAGAGLDINGCTRDWGWCDVDAGGVRGWISGRNLSADYDNRNESILEFGPALALPFLVFNQDEYWGSYYRDRPFYRDYRSQNFSQNERGRSDRSYGRSDFGRQYVQSSRSPSRTARLQATSPAFGGSNRHEAANSTSPSRAARLQAISPASGGSSRHEAANSTPRSARHSSGAAPASSQRAARGAHRSGNAQKGTGNHGDRQNN